MPTPLNILRQRNAAAGKPAALTPAQMGTGTAGTITLILAALYAAEGGFVHDPADGGGATNYGITEQVARENGYQGDMRDFPKHCYGKITVCSDKIYVEKYIEKPGFTPMLSIEPAVAQELVDTGVNMGTGTSSIFFQTALNVLCGAGLKVDGRLGPQSINAYSRCQRPGLCVTMLDALDGAQERRYRGIVAARPSQAKYLKGWLNRRIGNVPRSRCVKGDT